MARRTTVDPAAALGSRIKSLRRQLRLTQTAFGELLQVAQPTVARWESGRHMPDEEMIRRLAAIGRRSPADLRYGSDGTEIPPGGVAVAGELDTGWRIAWAPRSASERVAAPAAADPRNTSALRVRGVDLAPLRPGWLVLYTRDRRAAVRAALGLLCVVQAAERGEALLGELQAGSSAELFDLVAWDGTRWRDLRLAWAAPVIEIRLREG